MADDTVHVAGVEIFGDRFALAKRYASWLVGAGVERGLVGPREADRIWDRHLVNCVAVAALIPPRSVVADIGSGAGLPGLALAIARPDLRVILIESMLRRSEFLREVVTDMELATVEVRRARAEELRAAKLGADVVTARAVAPLAQLATWATPLLGREGCVLALKGAGAVEETSQGWSDVVRCGLTPDLVALVPARVSSQGTQADATTDSWLPGVRVIEQGHWDDAGAFVESAGIGISDADRFATVVRLSRRPHGLSRGAAGGLG